MTIDTDAPGAPPGRPEPWALASALAVAALGTVFVSIGRSNLASVLAWPASVALFLWAVRPSRTGRSPRLPRADRALALLLPFVPVLVRVLLTSPYRIHGDELLTAYFSVHGDFSPARFFDGVPHFGDWVAQFPSLFFALQRGFFEIFGDRLAEVRWSGVPYVWLSGFALFLAARRLAGRTTAVVAVLLYSCLALSLYIETTGLHFLSATALFTAFFACAVRLFQEGGTWDAAATGVVAGLCYLFYPSSFIAVPVLAAFALVAWIRARRVLFARWVLWPALGFVLTVAPFVPYAVRENDYFSERSKQVYFMGESTPETAAMSPAVKARTLLVRNFVNGLRSFYTPSLGGLGGYWFGEQPLFERASLAVFAAGLIAAAARARRRPEIGLAVFALALAFVTGIVLTLPPVAYHRLSVVCPLAALVLALPFGELERLSVRPPVLKTGIVAVGVALLAFRNVDYFSRIAMTEGVPQDLYLADWVNTRYPDRVLYVAAFPGYAYRKISYFATTRRRTPPISNYHAELLQAFRTDEKYLYLVAFPSEFRERFSKVDPGGRYIQLQGLREWAIFLNPRGPRP